MDAASAIAYAAMPLRLAPNRVWRTYRGGGLIDRWREAEDGGDSQYPEDWIASVVSARNSGRTSAEEEGLSRVDAEGGDLLLRDLVRAVPAAMLGRAHADKYGAHTGVLVKILDSAERLTIQTHPDREMAEKLFRSKFGKTEAWYVLGGRTTRGEPPYVLFGFKPGVTRERWERLFHEQDIAGMIGALNRLEVRPGQVILVEAGIPHAIGPGCFLVEIQEPTDYTIRLERVTPAGLKLDDMACHQGAGFDRMFDCFRYEGCSPEEIERRWFIPPGPKAQTGASYRRELLGYDRCPYFRMEEIAVRGDCPIDAGDTFSIVIAAEGAGRLLWEGGGREIRQGETYFMPAGLGGFRLQSADEIGTLRIVRCFPPQ